MIRAVSRTILGFSWGKLPPHPVLFTIIDAGPKRSFKRGIQNVWHNLPKNLSRRSFVFDASYATKIFKPLIKSLEVHGAFLRQPTMENGLYCRSARGTRKIISAVELLVAQFRQRSQAGWRTMFGRTRPGQQGLSAPPS